MEDKRVVSKDRGDALAREYGIKFMETSAKANINIERAFLELSQMILEKAPDDIEVLKQPLPPPSKGNSKGKCACG